MMRGLSQLECVTNSSNKMLIVMFHGMIEMCQRMIEISHGMIGMCQGIIEISHGMIEMCQGMIEISHGMIGMCQRMIEMFHFEDQNVPWESHYQPRNDHDLL